MIGRVGDCDALTLVRAKGLTPFIASLNAALSRSLNSGFLAIVLVVALLRFLVQSYTNLVPLMNDKDMLQRFFFENAPVRGEIVRLNTSYQTIIQQHPYSPLIRQLLGEALTVVCLLSALIKGKGRLTVQFRGNGKLKLLLAQCDDSFHLRGLVQYEGELSQNELLEAQQQGVLAIMVDSTMSNAKQYQGIVAWHGETFAQAIESYFMQSEQLPTRLWLSVSETNAAGLLLQVLPKEKPELLKNDWEHLVLLTDTLKPEQLNYCS